MVYALILSSVVCLLAVLAFCLVAQPSLWMKLWSSRRRYILVADTAAAAYDHTGIRLRLALVGVILATGALVIPAAFAAWQDADLTPRTVTAASPPSADMPWPHGMPQAESTFAECGAEIAVATRPVNNMPAATATTLPPLSLRDGANNNPAAAGIEETCFLPDPEPAAVYASRDAAAREFDPTREDVWNRTAVSHARRGANNNPEIP